MHRWQVSHLRATVLNCLFPPPLTSLISVFACEAQYRSLRRQEATVFLVLLAIHEEPPSRRRTHEITSNSRLLRSERPRPSGLTLCFRMRFRRASAWSSSHPRSMSRGEAVPEPGIRMCCTGQSFVRRPGGCIQHASVQISSHDHQSAVVHACKFQAGIATALRHW